MPGVRAFKKVANASEDTQKLQERLDEYFAPITSSAIIDGVLLKNVELTAGVVTEVSHKLGRELLGWIVVRRRANAQVWDTQDSNTFKSRTLWLNTSATVFVDLWVF
jgi:hypothetical protein